MPWKTSCTANAGPLARYASVATAVMAVTWPFLVLWGLDHIGSWPLLLTGVALLAWRAPGARIPAIVMALALLVLGLMGHATWGVRLYPVAINTLLFGVFFSSLFSDQSVVERLARIREPALPPSGIAYTRHVTMAWCVFFVINGCVSAWTVWKADMALWTLYNGLISYLLMGLMFGIEWVIRHFVIRRVT